MKIMGQQLVELKKEKKNVAYRFYIYFFILNIYIYL